MITRRALTTTALFALVVAGFALVAALLSPSPRAHAVQAAPVVAVQAPAPVVEPAPVATDPFLVALLGAGTELPANADELLLAADRVCEGLTAEVPVTTIEQLLAGQLGITLPEAHDYVETAATVHCSDLSPAPSVAETVSAPVASARVVQQPAQTVQAPAPAPVAHAPAATAPAPVVEQHAPDEAVAEQHPDEAIGGARCDDPEQVVVAIDADGEYVCGIA